MKILFNVSVRGGRENQPTYKQIVDILKQYGDVLSEHLAEAELPPRGETEITVKEVHDRQMEQLMECDVMVAEVTTPSLGVGYLIGRAVEKNKRVICLYQGESTLKLTGMISGSSGLELYEYSSEDDLDQIFKKTLG